MQEFEKLGAFYLGRLCDPESGAIRPDLLLYDSRDLTTHAVCVGMTGSGKTGLCLGLLEEAAIDGIPAIAIDPKGDLGNLLLTFPDLRGEDFRPWVDDGEAARAGLTLDAYAARTAETWTKGLADWGEDGARISRLREASDFAIYTPGSQAGLPLSVVRSFAAPPVAVLQDPDLLRERIQGSVSGLLALLGIDADPIRSREHILLSNLCDQAWRDGRDLDLPGLVREIQSPPLQRIGVLDLESFYPAKERTGLSMALNGLLAAPGFSAWMEGEPLDVGRLLYTHEGRPRISILSIAHLADAERMFFITLLLQEVVTWMRAQPGTTSLRALLYMDEIFGYFPPTANPPSKTPMLTLLKQARAYGLGVVLATQNPVDLDYKGLANAGTWFLGRLQTERDKARVMDGLEGASSASGQSLDRVRIEKILSDVKARVFLMHNVHEDEPVLFHTRWTLSYLRGPLTRKQIQTLMAPHKDLAATRSGGQRVMVGGEMPISPGSAAAQTVPGSSGQAERPAAAETAPAPTRADDRPILPPEIPEFFLPAAGAKRGAPLYVPWLLGTARVHFVSAKVALDLWETVTLKAPVPTEGADPWEGAAEVQEAQGTAALDLRNEPEQGIRFAALPPPAARPRSYDAWTKGLADYLYRTRSASLWTCPAMKRTSRPGESEADFRVRIDQDARERRDADVDALRRRLSPKLASLQYRIRRAEERLGVEQAQYQHAQMQTVVSVGAGLLGAFLGRRRAGVGTVGRAATAARGVSRAARERGDIARASESLEVLRQLLQDLEVQAAQQVAALQERGGPGTLEITPYPVRPRKTDISVQRLALVWSIEG